MEDIKLNCIKIYNSNASEENIDSVQRVSDYDELEKDDCTCCSVYYNQEIVSVLIRYHSSDNHEIIEIPTYYCPKCGKKLI